MAFSSKITFVPRDNGEKSISFNEVDYRLVPLGKVMSVITENLFNKLKSLNFREINNHYIDFVSVLTIEEFLDFHKNNHQDSDQNVERFIQNDIQKIRYNWVIIEVYEWESG